VIGFEDFINEETLRQTCTVLDDDNLVPEMVEHNYELGRRHYSYQALEKRLVALISECLGD
jgi:hypothetical protein